MSLTKFVGLLAGTALASSAFAASVESNTDAMSQIAELKKEIAELKSQNSDKWLTEQRADEIRSVVQDVLSDADTRSSLQAAAATSGYNNGFFISSPDGNFKLQINGQLQNRWAYNWLSTRDMNNSTTGGAAATSGTNFNAAGVAKSAYGFEVRRAKLEFSGHISDPSWQYAITMAYQQYFNSNNNLTGGASQFQGGGGVNQGDEYAGGIGLENAYVKKDMGNGFSVQVGQFKSPFLREWLVSSKYQLTVERSLVNTLFSTGWTQGIQANWNNDNLRVMASYNDGANNANLGSVSGTNQGNTGTFPGTGNNGVGFDSWAFTGRAEFMAFGNWAQFDQLTSMRGQAAGLLVGGGINWQRGGQNYEVQPATSNVAANGNADATFFSWTVDATWQLGGANLYGAWVMNTTYGQPNGQGNILGYGLVVQGGYFITDAIELFGRWEWMSTSSANGTSEAGDNVSYNSANNAFVNNIGTIGANWYISKNVKFTTDFGVSWNPVTFQQGIFGQNIAGADYRTEGSNGGGQLVFRSQLQLLF
jgi:hypothetical protein